MDANRLKRNGRMIPDSLVLPMAPSWKQWIENYHKKKRDSSQDGCEKRKAHMFLMHVRECHLPAPPSGRLTDVSSHLLRWSPIPGTNCSFLPTPSVYVCWDWTGGNGVSFTTSVKCRIKLMAGAEDNLEKTYRFCRQTRTLFLVDCKVYPHPYSIFRDDDTCAWVEVWKGMSQHAVIPTERLECKVATPRLIEIQKSLNLPNPRSTIQFEVAYDFMITTSGCHLTSRRPICVQLAFA